MGTALRYSHATPSIAAKAANYNIPAVTVDGMDVLAVASATEEAVNHIRSGQGPYFIEAITYRFRAHSMFDAELYRSKDEVAEWKRRDPILLFTALLKEQSLIDDIEIAAMEAAIDEEVAESVRFAEDGIWEPANELERFVYSERSLS